MENKYAMLIILLFFSIIAINAVYAEDVNDVMDELNDTSYNEEIINTEDISSQKDMSSYDKFINDLENVSDGGTVFLEDNIEISESFSIEKDITIDGNNHIIDAKKESQIFICEGNITLKNIIFKNAAGYRGGAIYSTNELKIDSCQFLNNNADEGGAIYSNNVLTLINCTLTGNGADVDGGAISNNYLLTIINSTISNNKAVNDAGAIKSWGGDIYIENSEISDNYVLNKNSNAARGGAIFINGNIEIINSTFKNNGLKSNIKSHDDAAKYDFNGGALYLYGESAKILQSTFEGNYAENHGGAISTYKYLEKLTIDDCEFKNNKANFEDGGAISFSGEKLILTNSKFNNNFAYEDGGAIDSYSGQTTGSSKYYVNVNIDKCNFNGNKAYKGAGAIWLGLLTKYTIKNSDFTNNQATFCGVLYMEGSSVNIDKCNFKKNKAAKITKETIKSKGGQVLEHTGGVIYGAGGNVKISNSVFQQNSADYGGAIHYSGKSLTLSKCELSNNNAKEAGGAIYNKGKFTISSCKINNNKASHGGALFNGGSSATITSSTFSDNTVSGSGGAIIVNVGKVTVKSSTFTKNTATYGGAISNKGTLTVSGSTFENNKATCGGAVFDDKGTCSLTSSVFKSNSAKKVGGALFYKSGKLTLKGNAFVSNKATSSKAVYCKKSVSLNNNWWGNIKKAPNKLKLTNVNVKTWLKLKISASPAKIAKGKKTTVSIDLRYNNKNKKVGSIAKVPITLTAKYGTLSVKTAKLSNGITKVKFQKTGKTGKVTANALGTKVTVTIK